MSNNWRRVCLLPLLWSMSALAEPLMPAENFIAQSEEASLLTREEIRQIDGYRVGDVYDNAMAGSFFASLECELIDRKSWQTKTEARLALFTYIEGWYNPRRRHSALEYLSPMNFESQHANTSQLRGQHGLPTVGVCVAAATPPVDNPALADIGRVENLSP